MKKGFTLIELLAVIVILAVIAVISTPIVVGVINNSRKESYKNSAYGIIDTLKYNYTHYVMNGEAVVTTNLLPDLKYSGAKPESGIAKLDNSGNTAIALKFSNYCLIKDFSDTEVSIIDYDASTCVINDLEIVDILYEKLTLNNGNITNPFFTKLEYGDYSNNIAGLTHREVPLNADNDTLTYTKDVGMEYYFGYEFVSPYTYYGAQVSMEIHCEECNRNVSFYPVIYDESEQESMDLQYDIIWLDDSNALVDSAIDLVSGSKYQLLFAAGSESINFSVTNIFITTLYIENGILLFEPTSKEISYVNPIGFLDVNGNDVFEQVTCSEDCLNLPTSTSQITKSNYDLLYEFNTPNGAKSFSISTSFNFYFIITMDEEHNLILNSALPSELTFKSHSCLQWTTNCLSVMNNKKTMTLISNSLIHDFDNSFALTSCKETCLSPGPINTILAGAIINSGDTIYVYKESNLLYKFVVQD